MTDERIPLSVIVPAFNESRGIVGSLETMTSYLSGLSHSSEIIVVDDGSTDGTFDRVCAFAADPPVQVRAVRYPENRGKGYALKVGFSVARGERLLFTDADLSVPIEHSSQLIRALDQGFEVAIGSRRVAGARISVHQPWYREVLGKVFTVLVRLMISRVSDATCGFKAFRREAGQGLFDRLRIYDWSFDAELLWLADSMGYSVIEVPVPWEHRSDTKVRVVRDVLNSLAGLMRIRLNVVSGVYKRPNPIEPTLEIGP